MNSTNEYDRKYAAAVKDLERFLIKEKHYFNLPHKLLKYLGFQVRPVYYNTLLANVIQHSVFFFIAFGVAKLLPGLVFGNFEIKELWESIFTGVFISTVAGIIYRHFFRSRSLTPWEKL